MIITFTNIPQKDVYYQAVLEACGQLGLQNPTDAIERSSTLNREGSQTIYSDLATIPSSPSLARGLLAPIQQRIKKRARDDLDGILYPRVKRCKPVAEQSEFEKYLSTDQSTLILLLQRLLLTYRVAFGVDFDDSRNRSRHILEYWKRAERIWPTLAKLARNYLAIPAAGVGVERLFNSARDICTYRRHLLKPETVGQLMMATCANRFDAITQQRNLERKEHAARQYGGDEDSSDDGEEEEVDEDEEVHGLISDDESLEEIQDTSEADSTTQLEPELPPIPRTARNTTAALFNRRRGPLTTLVMHR